MSEHLSPVGTEQPVPIRVTGGGYPPAGGPPGGGYPPAGGPPGGGGYGGGGYGGGGYGGAPPGGGGYPGAPGVGYGAQGQPGFGGPPAPQEPPKNTVATISLVTGIVAIVIEICAFGFGTLIGTASLASMSGEGVCLSCMCGLGGIGLAEVCGIAAVICGIVGKVKFNDNNAAGGNGFAITGIITGALAVLGPIILWLLGAGIGALGSSP